MAQLDIQEKRSSNTWAWVIGIIVIALIIWGLWELFDRDSNEVAPVTSMTNPPALVATPRSVATALTLRA
jgi:hypothetical protein